MNRLRHALAPFGVTRGDLLLAAFLLLLAALFGVLAVLLSPQPEVVSVRVNGTETCRLPLHEDCIRHVSEGNTIQIAGGTVRMIDADCPDRVCVRTGAISRAGQSIVCAPHKVVVTIVGGEKNSDYDVRTY